MKTLQANNITNEYDLSPNLIKYKIQNHLLSNHEILPLNRAQILAAQLEQEKLDEEERKRLIKEENDRKLKQNVKVYIEKQKEREEQKRQEEEIKQQRFEKKKEFNNRVKDQVLLKNKKHTTEPTYINETANNNMTFKQSSIHIEENTEGNNFDTFSFKEVVEEQIEEMPTMTNKKPYNPNIINIRDEIDNVIRTKFEQQSKGEKIPQDYRSYMDNLNQFEILNEINKNVDNLKGFRRNCGFNSSMYKNENSIMSDLNKQGREMSSKMDESIVNNKKTRKFVNELEKRR
jgi:hypothetical protein